jgi:ubiquitin-protein ligase E3 C
MGKARIAPGKTSGQYLVSTLSAYKTCLEAIPSDTLASIGVALAHHNVKGKSRETAITLDDEDTIMAGTDQAAEPSTLLDVSTSTAILSITRDPFLSHVIRISNHFSSTTRPALFAFLVSLLYAFPLSTGIKESIVNTLVYSSQSDSSRGLLRELWRGWIRSSALARALMQGSSTTSVTTSVAAALFNEAYQQDWPNLVLMAEMYSRCLLTLGDDEFFANPGTGGSDAMSRNPLSADEVIGFSALWRNIAFALYWQPELLESKDARGRQRTVVGTNVPLEALRKLATGLLQSLHTRECVFFLFAHLFHTTDVSPVVRESNSLLVATG